MSNLNDLIETLKTLENSIKKWHKCQKDSSYDKLKVEFTNTKSNHTCFETTAYLNSYVGLYGNSSCSTLIHIYCPDVFEKYFFKYLNDHIKSIFEYIIKEIKKDIAELSHNEIEKLKTRIKELKEIKKEIKGG